MRPSTGGVGVLVDLDAQPAGRVGVGRAGDAARSPERATARPPPGRRTRSVTSRDRADLGELALVAGDEQDALVVADVDRQGHVHGREDDGVVEGDQKKLGHVRLVLP